MNMLTVDYEGPEGVYVYNTVREAVQAVTNPRCYLYRFGDELLPELQNLQGGRAHLVWIERVKDHWVVETRRRIALPVIFIAMAILTIGAIWLL